MNLVDEKYISLLKVGKEACKVTRFIKNGAGGYSQVYAKFICDYCCQGGLSQPGRSMEQNMVERFTSLLCCSDKNLKVIDYLLLPFKITKSKRPELFFKFFIRGRNFFIPDIQVLLHGAK